MGDLVPYQIQVSVRDRESSKSETSVGLTFIIFQGQIRKKFNS
jgi:hypothetical protein